MNLSEAYKVLNVSEDVPPEQLKKKYKELTLKYHPDVNKSPDAESEFKKINEAYSLIQDYRENPNKYSQPNDFNPSDFFDFFNQGFNPFQSRQPKKRGTSAPININEHISFKESVLGAEKKIEFKRRVDCEHCSGIGRGFNKAACHSCQGRGVMVAQRGNFVYQTPCRNCNGKPSYIPCKPCNSQGLVDIETSLNVKIPAGVPNEGVLRLSNIGHFYAEDMMGNSRYGDVLLKISVEHDPDLSISGNNVHYTLNLSLLESLTGTKKKIRTIDDEREVEIPPSSRNLETITIPKMGVARAGDQVVILNVQYPEDKQKLIKYLRKHYG